MSLVSDPNILTKDRLKDELQKHNITLPRSDSKKSVYVDLYKRELLDKREKLEFSDDEIEFSSSKRKVKSKTPVKKPTKTGKVTPSRVSVLSQSIDVTSLSDAELTDKLQEFGVNAGPIMESTRKLYQKKLEKLLADAPKEPPPVKVISASVNTLTIQDEFSDNTQDEEENEPEPEPPKPKPVAVKKSPARSEKLELKRSALNPRTTRRSYEEPKDQVDYSSPRNISNNTNLVTRRYTTQEVTKTLTTTTKPYKANNVVTQVAPPKVEAKKPQPAQKRRIPVWVQVAIFLFLAITIFLIIQNMEPASMNPFKSQLLSGK